MEWSGFIAEARRLYRCSILDENLESKKQYLLEAAQRYLSASQETSDNQYLRESLVSLSISCISEAERLHEFLEIRSRSKTRTDSINNTEDSIGLIHQERLLQEIHSRRISGLQQLPKEQAPTSAQVLSDVLALEKCLAELGVRRPVSSTAATLEQPTKNNQAVRYNSSIGESYMVLQDELEPSSNSLNIDQRHRPMDYSMISLPAVNKQFLHNHGGTASIPNQNKKLSPSVVSGNASLSGGGIIPFWSRSSPVDTKITTSIKPSESFVDVMDGLAWNEQSTILADSSKQGGGSNSETASINDKNNATAPDDQMEAINRLLTVISTLKDENDKLSEQNEVITLNMQAFKVEYEDKLHDIRDQLEQIKHEPLPVVAMAEEKGKGSDAISTDSNSRQLIAAYQVALERAKAKEQRHSERRTTLEKTIFGLMERYKTLEEEVKKKDRAIARLRGVAPGALATQHGREYTQPMQSQQQQQQLQQPSIRTYHNSQSAPQISGMEAGEGGGNSSLNTDSQGQAQTNGNRHGHPTAAMAQLGTIHTYSRRQAPAAKHPSVSTLESLQKAGKIFPK